VDALLLSIDTVEGSASGYDGRHIHHTVVTYGHVEPSRSGDVTYWLLEPCQWHGQAKVHGGAQRERFTRCKGET
jgi:hypothetical protein